MEIIDVCEPVQSKLSGQLTSKMSSLLQGMGIFLRGIKNDQHRQQILSFEGQVRLPKTKQNLQLLFELSLGRRSARLRVKVGKEGSCLGEALCCFVRSKWQDVGEFICQTNNLRLINSDSILYLLEATGQVGLQVNINGIHFISSQTKLLMLMRAKILHAIRVFSEELETIIFYYKLPGVSQHHYELQIQAYNHVPLQKSIQKIMLLRQLFEQKRQERRHSFYTRDTTTNTLAFPFSLMYGPYYPYSNAIQGDARTRTVYEFQQEKKLLLNDLEKYQSLGFDPILTTIEIKQRIRQKMIDSGGYSEIISGIYSFIPQLSIHKETNEELDMKNYLKTGYHLVKKKSINKKLEPSLKNQFNFLYYMRNKVCPYLAKYYCNNTIRPFSDHELYLQYYPNSLADCRLREKQKTKVLEDISMGLLFLAQEGVIHRDLKELNVMVDRRKRGRLIDFGSVASSVGNRFKPVDDKIRSTEGYFLPYSEAVKAVPSIAKQLSKAEFYNHRNFDQYGLGKIIHNQFYLDYIVNENHMMRHNLKYLSQKCMEPDPEDRLTQVEIVIFLRQLMLFDVLRSQFWKIGFDQQCRPHTFGRLQGEREMRIEQHIPPQFQ